METENVELYQAIDIDGYNIEPWGLGEIEKLTPIFKKIYDELLRQDIKLDEISKNNQAIAKVVFALLPEISGLLSITLNKPLDEVRKFKPDRVLKMVVAIASQNIGYLKNSLGPISKIAAEVVNG